jgi:putative pyruvate formate lyase activating enzyme
MPDVKRWDNDIALKLSRIKKYPHFARLVIKEMRRQVVGFIIERHQ